MRKLILVFLCLCFVFSVISATAQTDDVVVEVSSAQGDEYVLSNYKLLSRLGIVKFDEKLLQSAKTITVRDFAEMTLNALNIGTSEVVGETVNSSMSFYGFETGLKYEDGMTYKFAAKIILKCLGYHPEFLNIQEHDYKGWLNIANQMKIFAGVNAYSEDYVTYKDAVNIWANALEIDMVMLDSITNMGNAYKIQKGKTILTEYLHVNVIEGVVEANEYSSLYGESTLGKNQIKIDGITYNTSYNESIYYLGYNVMAYYTDLPQGYDNIIFMRLLNNNEALVLDTRDIESYNSYKYTYYVGSKIKTIDIKNAAVIYNQKYLKNYATNKMLPENGEIVFVDNDGNSRYDVVLISAFETTTIVDYVAYPDMYVIDKYSSDCNIYLDTSKYDILEIVDVNGNKMDVSKIKSNDVITTAKSIDGKIMTAIVSNNSVAGKLASIKRSVGEVIFEVGENEYHVQKAAYKRFEKKIITGNTYKFTLDYNENIIDMQVSGVDLLKYGYLRYARYHKDDLHFQILTDDNKIIEFLADDEIDINNQKNISNSDVLNLSWVDLNKPQLIRYKTNSKGFITAIETAEATDELKESEHIYKIYETTSNTNLKWYSGQKSFEGRLSASENASVFTVPSAGQNFDDDMLFAFNKSTKVLDNGFESFIAYTDDKNSICADIIVAVGNSLSAAEKGYGNTMIISEVRSVSSVDDNGALKISGVTRYGFETFTIDNSKLESGEDYSPGDIVRYTSQGEGIAFDIVKMFDYEEGVGLDNISQYSKIESAVGGPSKKSLEQNNVSTMQYILERQNSYIRVNEKREKDPEYSSSTDMYWYLSGKPLYVFHVDERGEYKITEVSSDNIPDSKTGKNPYIYLFMAWADIKFGVIYMN